MKTFLNKVWQLGLNQNLSYEESKRVVLSNKLFFLYVVIVTPYVYVFQALNSLFMTVVAFFISLHCVIALFLNYKQYYWAARVLFVLSIAIPTYLCSAILGPESGVQYICFAIMIASYLLFSKRESKLRLIFLVFHMATYISLELMNYRFMYKIVLEPTDLMIIRILIILSIFIIIGLTVKFYSDLTEHYKLSSTTLQNIYSITDRETEIVVLLLQGKSNKDIAQELFVEEVTIKKHMQNIFKKFNVSNRTSLMALLLK
jgi:DNA-binding CsgD family transcriptional regulator